MIPIRDSCACSMNAATLQPRGSRPIRAVYQNEARVWDNGFCADCCESPRSPGGTMRPSTFESMADGRPLSERGNWNNTGLRKASWVFPCRRRRGLRFGHFHKRTAAYYWIFVQEHIGLCAPRMPTIRPNNAEKSPQQAPRRCRGNLDLPQATVRHSRGGRPVENI